MELRAEPTKPSFTPIFDLTYNQGRAESLTCVTMQLSCYQEGVRSQHQHKLPCLPHCCIEYPYLNCNVNILFERTCL